MYADFFRNKHVLITGHTGFKGSWLAVWLLQLGAKVSGFALRPENEEDHFILLDLGNKVNHNLGDIRNIEQLREVITASQPDIVFHLAAQPLVRRSYLEPKLTFDTNIGGAINLLEILRELNRPLALVFITSDKCYRNKEWTWGYRENDDLGGIDPYSASKASAELIVKSYRESFFNNDSLVKIATARAGNVIGGGDWSKDRIIPDCIRALRKQKKITIRNPHATRPWQHVLEPLSGYLQLAYKLYTAEENIFSSAWNFGPTFTESRPVGNLVQDVVRVWGKGEYVIAVPANQNFHEDTLLNLNCDKAHNRLGWRPTWGYQQSIQHTIYWYKRWHRGDNAWDITTSQIRCYMEDFLEQGGDT